MTLNAFGDSITLGYGLSAPSLDSFVSKVAASLGLTVVNGAALAAQAGDQAFAAYGYLPNAANIAIIQIGTNDQWRYSTDATKRAFFVEALRALILEIDAPARVTGRSGSMTLTGTWSDTQVNSIGKSTLYLGAKASAVVSGTTIYIGTILQDHPQAGGTATVKVDGVLVGTINALATGITTFNGMAYPPVAFRFSGLSAGSHTVEVEVTSSGKYFYVDYIAGNTEASLPAVYVGNVPRMTAAAYASLGGSDANVVTYNTAIAALIAEFVADGLNVHPVDTYSAINPATDLQADGTHPTAAGHQKIANAYLAAINGPPAYTFVAGQSFKRNDGTWWVGVTTPEKQINTLP